MDKHLIKELKYLQYGFISMDAIPTSLIAMDCFVFIAVFFHKVLSRVYIHTRTQFIVLQIFAKILSDSVLSLT